MMMSRSVCCALSVIGGGAGDQFAERVGSFQAQDRRTGGGVVAHRSDFAGIAQPFGNQGFERVDGGFWVQVEHQPVSVCSHWREREHLGQRGLFKVNHKAHHAGSVLADADARDVGVVGPHLGHQFAQLGAQVQALDVYGQARRRANEKFLCP